VGVVAEGDVGQFQLAAPLDVDLAVGVDQDVGHAGIGQQRLQRAEAEHLVLDVARQVLALGVVDDHRVFFQQFLDQVAQLDADLLRRQALQAFEVDAVQQRGVQALLELLVGAVVDAACTRWPEPRMSAFSRRSRRETGWCS
jgi:hypothetical protein